MSTLYTNIFYDCKWESFSFGAPILPYPATNVKGFHEKILGWDFGLSVLNLGHGLKFVAPSGYLNLFR